MKKETKNPLKRSVMLILASATLAFSLGCGSKSADDTTSVAPPAGEKTRNDMPPEVKQKMEQQQAEMKARAEAQGKAMQGSKR